MLKFITKINKSVQKSIRGNKSNGSRDDKNSATSKLKVVVSSVVKRIISVAENMVWLFFIFLLIFMLIIASIIFAVMGSALGVISITSTSVNNNINVTVGEGGGITDYNTYDWYGNMTANLLKLKTNKEKNLYRVITMAYQLKEETSDTSRFWTYIAPEYLIGTGIVEGQGTDYFSGKDVEDSGGNYHNADGTYINYTGTDADLDNELDVSKHLRYDVWGTLYQYIGDDSSLWEWDKYTPEEYHGKVGDCTIPTDKKLLGQHFLPYTIHMMAYKGTKKNYDGAFNRLFTNIGGSAMTVRTANDGDKTSVDVIKDKLKEYGLESSDENVNNIARVYSYAGHWSGIADDTWRTALLEVIVSAYAEANGDMNGWLFDSMNIGNARNLGTVNQFISSDETSSVPLSVNGKTLNVSFISYLKGKYSGKHSDWSAVQTVITRDTSEARKTLFMTPIIYIMGHSLIKNIADQCNIVLEDTSVVKDWGASTQTVNAMLTLIDKWYNAHGVTSSSPWTYGFTPPDKSQSEDESGSFGDEWCAYTVRSTFQHVKINGASTTLYDAIRKESGGTAFFTTDFADLGYDNGNTNIYGSTKYGDIGASSIASNKYVAMHFTGNYKGWVRQDPAIDYMGKISKETRYVPKAGDIIIYMYGVGHYSHVGIVAGCDGKTVKTIEGNTGGNTSSGAYMGSCYAKHEYSVDSSNIAFYISVDYVGLEKKYGTPSSSSSNQSEGAVSLSSYLNGSGKSESDIEGSQLVVVQSNGTSATVTALQKSGSKWYNKLSTSGYVGSGGVGTARENKSVTPKGLYYLGKNFGGFGIAMSGLKIGWRDVSSTQSYWGTSNNSSHLNRFYTASKKEVSGDEDLTAICKSGAYKYSVLIEYNYSNAKKGAGSAFFLHVGSSATAGCVAIPESAMLNIVKWLDKSKSPQILIY